MSDYEGEDGKKLILVEEIFYAMSEAKQDEFLFHTLSDMPEEKIRDLFENVLELKNFT